MTTSTAPLFTELRLKDVVLRNRVAVSPMCQYMAQAGIPNEWHHVHLGARAIGGAGLIVAEATAVSPEGRITWADTGLWSDAHTEAWRPIVSFLKAHGAVPGIQIAHAGRKASANRPWEGDDHLPGDHANGWDIIGPTGEAFGANLPRAPREMTVAEIHRVTKDFAAAAKRAADAGFEWLELHFAHGYLAQSFFSPLVNTRTDEYGGSFAGRARFLLETLAAVREVWPARLPLTARLGVVDFVPGEQPFAESIELLRLMKEGGLDLVDVSHGINTKDAGGQVPWGKPAFLTDHARQIREEVKIPTALSWGAGEAHLANELVASKVADVVMVARAWLDNPNWALDAAKKLGLADPLSVLPAAYAHWLKTFAPPVRAQK